VLGGGQGPSEGPGLGPSDLEEPADDPGLLRDLRPE